MKIDQIHASLSAIIQGTKSVDEYYSNLVRVWEELQPPPHCKCGGCCGGCFAKYENRDKTDKVLRFLRGLNECFSSIRANLIQLQPFPTLDDVYNAIRKDEAQWKMTKALSQGVKPTETVLEGAAMATLTDGTGKPQGKKSITAQFATSKVIVMSGVLR